MVSRSIDAASDREIRRTKSTEAGKVASLLGDGRDHHHVHKEIVLAYVTLIFFSLPVLDHILQIVLHMIQIFVSYLLMLVFMTYNVWLAVSILFGSGVGYGLFNVRIRVRGCEQVAPSKKSEHCQH